MEKYKYEDIEDLEQLKNIVLKEMNERVDDKKFIKEILGYLDEIIDELSCPDENVARCNEIIEETLSFLNEEWSDLKCPLCEEKAMKHIERNGTHIYVCEPCPFVGFESVDINDINNMIEFLEERK